MGHSNNLTGLEIAVVGLAGTFPGAGDIDALWENLKNGIESIASFSEEELLEAGVDANLLKEPDYIKAIGHLENKDCFDAAFFGYTPAEAAVMDPQLRLFHQCVWTALEHAGYNPEAGDETIGLFAGASSSFNWEALTVLSGDSEAFGGFEFSQYSCKDFLSTRIAYKFNFHGPAVTLNTACSTSLVAIDMACRSLLTGQCHMAVAGGVTVMIPYKSGYTWQEGMIYSKDGHCRAFDDDASGTVGGEGAGAVVLRLLEDALERRDTIHAVIKGTALNNDGNRKVGFSAPSIGGQADVIKTARLMAEVPAETIGYIEAHGTGTSLGDPIEIQALSKAFASERTGFCAVGALKTNVGHLDSAAGVAGFIKTVLVLKHKQIPPTLHFKNPNKAIDFDNSPFYVNAALKDFEAADHPRRAAVSSFGIGGTNAHAILEEADAFNQYEETASHRNHHLLLLSAQTTEALDTITENLSAFLIQHPDTAIIDAAFTLQVGRRHMRRRRVLVCAGIDDAVDGLSPSSPRVRSADAGAVEKPLVFMFSGQGSQYVNMGRQLYHCEPGFRDALDEGFALLNRILDREADLFLFPTGDDEASLDEAKRMLDHVLYSGPVKLVFEHALAKLLMSWGIMPSAMIGHSFGEYAVAALAGVMSLEDALRMAVWRGQLMEETPDGAMLSVPLSEAEATARLTEYPDVSPAAINGPNLCIVSGPRAAVADFEASLQREGVDSLRVNFPRASHSRLMSMVSTTFRDRISASITLKAPSIPYISGLSGDWITGSEAVNPAYWARHLEEPIRFFDGLSTLLSHKNYLFVQVGSDRGLPLFLDSHPRGRNSIACVTIMKHPKEPAAELDYFYGRIADIWLHGGVIDWFSFYGDNPGRRVPLPTYPFAKQRFEIKGDPFVVGSRMLAQDRLMHKKEDMADWFYFPGWQQSVLPKPQSSPSEKNWLVLANSSNLSDALLQTLKTMNASVAAVKRGDSFAEDPGHREFVLDPKEASHYDRLLESLSRQGFTPDKIVHLWNVNEESDDRAHDAVDLEAVTQSHERGLFSLMGIVQALGRQLVSDGIDIEFVTDGLFEVTGSEPALDPLKSTALGAIKIIPLEYPTIRCRCVDVPNPTEAANREERLLELLIDEFLSPIDDQVVAIRGAYRWVQSFRPERLPQSTANHPHLRERGVYLILGGFGGMGFSIAGHLARHYKAKLALVGRRGLPSRDEWDRYISEHDSSDPICGKILNVREMEAHGAEVLCFATDISDSNQMTSLLDEVRQQFGPINGVIHAAGVIDYDGIIQNRTREQIRKNIASKVEGTLLLDQLLAGETLDFMALFSSMGDVLFEEKFGEVGYGAANEFMDAFSYYKRRKDGTFAFTINWNDWKEAGMALEAVDHKIPGQKTAADYDRILFGGLSRQEGVEVFLRALEHGLPRIAVWTSDLLLHLEQQKIRDGKTESYYQPIEEESALDASLDNRPDLSVPYAKPESATQEKLVSVWEHFFGIRPIGIRDNFFELGGHSLRAISMVAAIHKELNVKIPLNILFASPTVAELAEAIEPQIKQTDKLNDILAQVESLSADQVKALLNKTTTGQ